MEEVLPETLQRGKKVYEVGTEVPLRSLSPKTPLFSHPPGCAGPYLICQQPRFLQHAPAGSLHVILETDRERWHRARAATLSDPHPLSSWPKGSAIAGSLPPSGDGAVTYGTLWVLGEDEAVDMSHSHGVQHGTPVWTECTGHQGPEVELEEGQVVFRRLRVAFQGHRQL